MNKKIALFSILALLIQNFLVAGANSPNINKSDPLLRPKLVPAKSVEKKPVQYIEKKLDKTVISLSDYIRSYPNSYQDTFIAILAALPQSNINITSYDTSKGQINAKYRVSKGLYIVILPTDEKTTMVRITPADGVYDIPMSVITGIFNNIKFELDQIK